jgi:hypothetical protein
VPWTQRRIGTLFSRKGTTWTFLVLFEAGGDRDLESTYFSGLREVPVTCQGDKVELENLPDFIYEAYSGGKDVLGIFLKSVIWGWELYLSDVMKDIMTV